MAILFFILLLSGVAVIYFSKLAGQSPTSTIFLVIAVCVEIAGVLVIAVFGYLRHPPK
jgi:glycerol uptake facilitator-like aquaporin